MTKKRLEEYRDDKKRIGNITYKLNHIKDGDNLVGNSVIKDYRTGYPRPQSVVGFDREKYEKEKARLEDEKARLERKCEEVEAFLDTVQESRMKDILEKYYKEGKTQEQVAEEMGLERSTVSKKISEYLQLSHKSQKSHI